MPHEGVFLVSLFCQETTGDIGAGRVRRRQYLRFFRFAEVIERHHIAGAFQRGCDQRDLLHGIGTVSDQTPQIRFVESSLFAQLLKRGNQHVLDMARNAAHVVAQFKMIFLGNLLRQLFHHVAFRLQQIERILHECRHIGLNQRIRSIGGQLAHHTKTGAQCGQFVAKPYESSPFFIKQSQCRSDVEFLFKRPVLVREVHGSGVVEQNRHASTNCAGAIADENRLEEHEQHDHNGRHSASDQHQPDLLLHPRTLALVEIRDRFERSACQEGGEEEMPMA